MVSLARHLKQELEVMNLGHAKRASWFLGRWVYYMERRQRPLAVQLHRGREEGGTIDRVYRV